MPRMPTDQVLLDSLSPATASPIPMELARLDSPLLAMVSPFLIQVLARVNNLKAHKIDNANRGGPSGFSFPGGGKACSQVTSLQKLILLKFVKLEMITEPAPLDFLLLVMVSLMVLGIHHKRQLIFSKLLMSPTPMKLVLMDLPLPTIVSRVFQESLNKDN
jgi:hypothetical protein